MVFSPKIILFDSTSKDKTGDTLIRVSGEAERGG